MTNNGDDLYTNPWCIAATVGSVLLGIAAIVLVSLAW
jgi:uncharacterized membrane protein